MEGKWPRESRVHGMKKSGNMENFSDDIEAYHMLVGIKYNRITSGGKRTKILTITYDDQ